VQNPFEKAIGQLIVVRSLGNHFATLCTYERARDSWIRKMGPFDAVIGKNGITDDKQEGDGKTPTGIFPLNTLFGNKEHRTDKMPFISIHEHLEAVDDPDSKHYNTIVDRRILEVDWNSSEKMKDYGFLYEIGAVIGYNTENPIPGKGSCIFMHVWRSPIKGTAGCVALSYSDMKALANWLAFDRFPHILVRAST
jgi:L,D-peptidoglycan transpeptidase YkuD (ErfK/YbiS/YcfS/YnhG family)